MSENLILVDSMDKLRKLTDALMTHAANDGLVGFDVETGYEGPDREKGSLDVAWQKQFVCGFSVSPGRRFAAYVPLLHDLGPNLDPEEVWPVMKPLLESARIVAHNAKFEVENMAMLEEKGYGPKINLSVYADSMLEAFVLSEWKGVGLKDMVKAELGHEMAKIETLFAGYTASQIKALRFNKLELTPQVVEYAAEDALWCVRLHEKIGPRAVSERGKMLTIEMGIAALMAEVELRGVQVDAEALAEHAARADAFCARMETNLKAALSEWSGKDQTGLSLNSPRQMQALLYRDLGVKTTRLTGGAAKTPEKYSEKESWQKLSTDDVALESASRKHPEIRMLLELRQAYNLAKRLRKWLEEYTLFYSDHRVHPQYSQVTVGTGRFAANFPAIQQCPKEWRFTSTLGVDPWKDAAAWQSLVEEGKVGRDYWTGNFRDVIVAAPGHYFLTYDYSQIELRIMAGVSQEPALLQAFENDEDVHTLTAAMMLGKPKETVDPKQERPIGKTMNFGLLYQMQAKSLAERLGVSLERGKELYAAYFASFSSITNWMDRAKEQGRQRGYIETPFGRKWTIWELQSSNRAIYAKGERMLVNAPIQGGAADYMKIAMLRAKKVLEAKGWWGQVMIVMNQHDALTFEVSDALNPQEVRSLLEPAIAFRVPGFPKITPDWELGKKWGSATGWKPGLVPHWDGEFWTLVPGEGGDGEPNPQPVVEPVGPPQVSDKSLSTAEAFDAGRISEQAELPKGVSLVLTLLEMPTWDQFTGLKQLLEKNIGPNSLVIRTPEGDIESEYGTSLSLDDAGRFAVLIPGAVIRKDAATLQPQDLLAGMKI